MANSGAETACPSCKLERVREQDFCGCGYNFRTQQISTYAGFKAASAFLFFVGLIGLAASVILFMLAFQGPGGTTDLPIVISGAVASLFLVWLGSLGPLILNVVGLLRRILGRLPTQ